MSKQPNYTEAFEELQLIATEIEDGTISIDQLSAKVKRAIELIAICKAKLSATESEIEGILKKADDSAS